MKKVTCLQAITALLSCALAKDEVTLDSGYSSTSEKCTCVPYYFCKASKEPPTGLIDNIRNEDTCQHYLQVCCSTDDLAKEKIEPPKASPERKGCGYRNDKGLGIHVGLGSNGETEFGEFPWMVAILKEDNDEATYICGGSLIHPQVVLTAAHCLKNQNSRYKVRAGEWDPQTGLEIYPHQERSVKSIRIHPQYNSSRLFNDVALLFLKDPVQEERHISPVCLPPQGTLVANTSCFITGWGKDVFGQKGKYQAILKKTELPIVDSKTCEMQLQKTRLGPNFKLDESFICAGGEEGSDTCRGDGGAPLVCPIPGMPNRYYQVGIVSWGLGCAQKDISAVFVNVPLLRGWIGKELLKSDLDPSSYSF